MYVTRFETSGFRPLATFEEDIDVTTGSEPGVSLGGDSLATWREATLELRSSNRTSTSASQENQAVFVGWNNRIAGADTARHGPPARYTVALPGGLASRWAVGAGHTLDFMLAPTPDLPPPREAPEDEAEQAAADVARTGTDESDPADGDPADDGTDDAGARDPDDEDAEHPPVDLTIEVADRAGRTARVTLSDYGAIRRPLDVYVLRRRDQEAERFQNHWELIQQTYSIPLGDFVAAAPGLDLRSLTEIRFIFDGVHAGEVAIDQIGLSALDPAFLGARVEGP